MSMTRSHEIMAVSSFIGGFYHDRFWGSGTLFIPIFGTFLHSRRHSPPDLIDLTVSMHHVSFNQHAESNIGHPHVGNDGKGCSGFIEIGFNQLNIIAMCINNLLLTTYFFLFIFRRGAIEPIRFIEQLFDIGQKVTVLAPFTNAN
jgi:hypothetical protein